MMTQDIFTDSAILRTRIQTGSNDLGEPIYESQDKQLSGLLVRRPRQSWTDLGLVGGTEATFMTVETIQAIPAGAVLIVGDTTFRKVTLNRRTDLWNDDGITRLLLQEGP